MGEWTRKKVKLVVWDRQFTRAEKRAKTVVNNSGKRIYKTSNAVSNLSPCTNQCHAQSSSRPTGQLSHFYCWARCHKVWNIPLDILCLLCPLPVPCAPTAPCWHGRMRGWKGIDSVQALLCNSCNISVSSTLFSSSSQNTAQFQLLFWNSNISQLKLEHV